MASPASALSLQNHNFIPDPFVDLPNDPTNTNFMANAANTAVVAANTAAAKAAEAMPVTPLEDKFIKATMNAFVDKGVNFVSQPVVKAGLIGIAILLATGVVYYSGKYICNKMFGDDKTARLLNNPVKENSDVRIEYNDGKITNLSGRKLSGDLNWREIRKIEIQ